MGEIYVNLTEILSNSFRYPFSNPKRALILAILTFFSSLIIPAILANGYMLRIMKYSFEGSEELPPFNEWLNMFVDGLKVIIVNIVYTFIPAFITAFITILIVMSMLFNGPNQDYNVFYNTFLMVLLVVGIIVMTVPYLFSLMALPHIVRKDKLDVLLELKNLLNIIRGIGWGKFISAAVLITVLNIPLVGLGFYIQFLRLGTLELLLISAVMNLVIGWYLLAFRGRLLALLYEKGEEELQLNNMER